MRIKNKRGMTLVEVLIACLVFSIALAALLGSLVAIVSLIDTARDKTAVNSDLKDVMERIRATPFDVITTKFPNGLADGPASNLYSTIAGGYLARNEHITVSYANPNTDPLEIKARATWQDKQGRAYNTSFSTFRTR